jgi:aspartate aminotransferase
MNKEYKKRHDFVVSELNKIEGVECKPTDGTFYVFPSFKKFIHKSNIVSNDEELALYILEKSKVAVVPGSAFGIEGHIRISIAIDMDSLKDSMQRLKNTLIL